MAMKAKRTEHAGAKNGGGFWGYRAEAKRGSDKRRRANDRAAVDEGARERPDRPERDGE